ncbi:MAG: tRNA-intron lyase [Candidatus Ranarchaeia archaeon]
MIGTRVIVWDSAEGRALYREAFYGKPVGIRKPKTADFDRPLELGLIEAYYLLTKKRLEVFKAGDKKPLSPTQFHRRASQSFENFTEKYLVYKDLRDKGLIVKPGLKFGADFAVYEHGPGIDHAPFIVHVNQKGNRITAIEMVRAGRLATSVRKKFVIASIDRNRTPRYFAFHWFKP